MGHADRALTRAGAEKRAAFHQLKFTKAAVPNSLKVNDGDLVARTHDTTCRTRREVVRIRGRPDDFDTIICAHTSEHVSGRRPQPNNRRCALTGIDSAVHSSHDNPLESAVGSLEPDQLAVERLAGNPRRKRADSNRRAKIDTGGRQSLGR